MSEAPHQHAVDASPNTNAQSSLEGAKNSAYSSVQAAMDSASNNQTVQNLKNGPVGQTVSEQKAKTQNEFQDLANAKRTPDQPTATGQPLTHYHSLFYRLLSWKNPRATGIAYVTTVAFIFLARYLNILRYIFKGTYTVLGITAAAEVVGNLALGEGLTTKIRPKKYFVIQRESMERFLDDIEQLTNFFVIESQRIVYAENVYVTVAAFFSAFLSYWLIKWLPLWGLTLISANVVFLAPLIYTQNKELIDSQLHNAGDIINKQTAQARDIAGQYTSKAQESVGAYTRQAHDQISGLIGQKNKPTASDYPQAPKQEPYPSAPTQTPAAEVIAEGQQPIAAPPAALEGRFGSLSASRPRRLSGPQRETPDDILEPGRGGTHAKSILHAESLSSLLAKGRMDEQQDVHEDHENPSLKSTLTEPPSSVPSRTNTFYSATNEVYEASSQTSAGHEDDSDGADAREDRRNTAQF